MQLPLIIDRVPLPEIAPVLIQTAYQQHSTHCYDGETHNFELADPLGHWLTVWDILAHRAQSHLGFTIDQDRNYRGCYAYVTDSQHQNTDLHNHQQTADINLVWYLTVPEGDSYRDSAISFYSDRDLNSEIFCYRPQAGDLLIFPGYVWHRPEPCAQGFRIAINTELRVRESVDSLFDRF